MYGGNRAVAKAVNLKGNVRRTKKLCPTGGQGRTSAGTRGRIHQSYRATGAACLMPGIIRFRALASACGASKTLLAAAAIIFLWLDAEVHLAL